VDHRTNATVKTSEVVQEKPLDDNLIGDRTPELPAEVVRMKYFAMPPMTIEEALTQLQLVDHDFYMFCNKDTNEINVIYQRNHGGFGVIQPRPVNVNGKESN
jgi:putative sigma-54 modulation protein